MTSRCLFVSRWHKAQFGCASAWFDQSTAWIHAMYCDISRIKNCGRLWYICDTVWTQTVSCVKFIFEIHAESLNHSKQVGLLLALRLNHLKRIVIDDWWNFPLRQLLNSELIQSISQGNLWFPSAIGWKKNATPINNTAGSGCSRRRIPAVQRNI